MSERYTKLFALPEQTIRHDLKVPVEVVAGALLKDNQSETVLAQIKYKNISSKSIKSISVNLSAQDTNGVKISGVENYAYENLIAAQGDCFGDKTPVVMNDNNAHAFSVDVISVAFSDGTTWNKFNQQAATVAKEIGAHTVPVAKAAAKTATTKIIPFLLNLAVFLLLLSFAVVFLLLLPEEHTVDDVISAIGFGIASIISFPAFGKKLAKKKNGALLRVLRWVLVVLIIFGMSAILRAI